MEPKKEEKRAKEQLLAQDDSHSTEDLLKKTKQYSGKSEENMKPKKEENTAKEQLLAQDDSHSAYFFDRDDVALYHFKTFSKNQSDEKLKHAQKFLKYLNKRGGHIVLQDIKKPERDDWRNSLEVLEIVMQMEKKINQALLNLHNLAMEKSDPHLCDFLEREYLDEQVTIIKCLGDYITNLSKLGVPESGLGEYLFDKLTLGDSC